MNKTLQVARDKHIFQIGAGATDHVDTDMLQFYDLKFRFDKFPDQNKKFLDWNFYNLNSYLRIALPDSVNINDPKSNIIQKIKQHGYRESGFDKIGDTIMPASLSWQDKMALANTKKMFIDLEK